MKILVIGSGGREHAMIWKIAQSKKVDKIYCTPGNPGTMELAENIPIKVSELSKLVQFAKKKKIDLTVVGPEIPLIGGIVDLFKKNKLKVIGPSKKAAQIEGSKVFAKKLMMKYKIPTADFMVFDDYSLAKNYLQSAKYPLVVKADGLCAGKGVALCKDAKGGQKFLKELMVDKIFGKSSNHVLIEECLDGPEVSFMLASDGKNFISLIPSQDHKPIFDGDLGPNTGGMGAYAPVPFVSQKMMKRIEKEIVMPIINAMKKEGIPYEGILYPGIILTEDGPKVLEFNCRFGDPETQPLMFMLESDIIDLFDAIINKKLKNFKLLWHRGAAICIVLTAKGYPGEYEKRDEIFGLDKLKHEKNIITFHSGTKLDDKKLVTNGGRVLGVTAIGKDLKSAIYNAYKYIGKYGVNFSGMHYRKDIGKKGLSK
ncbi:phosphoribosylamine--glycine ligase [Candidatus Gottesmanbacteria bacterium]|nr:phosphoribosylamine--glycine ligase [Candidatus Gottesmanbacteria bacterium]